MHQPLGQLHVHLHSILTTNYCVALLKTAPSTVDANRCNTLGSVYNGGICNTLGSVCTAGICNTLDSVYSKLFSSYILSRSNNCKRKSRILLWWTDGHLLPHLGVMDRWPPTLSSWCGGQMATSTPILRWTDGHLLLSELVVAL